jgi:glycosyltransferase involved in cell wall biosynthesis
VLRALAKTPDAVSLVVAGYETAGHRGYVESLRREAEGLSIAHRVTFAGTVPTRDALMAQCRTCDLGLALMPARSADVNERAMVGASNKAFDYLACGLALLVSDLAAWRETFADAGFGRVCDPDSPDSIASALGWFLDHADERIAMGERGRQRVAADWNYDHQFAPVLARIV